MNKQKLDPSSGSFRMLEDAIDSFEERVELLQTQGKKIDIEHLIDECQNEFNMSNEESKDFADFIYDAIEQ